MKRNFFLAFMLMALALPVMAQGSGFPPRHRFPGAPGGPGGPGGLGGGGDGPGGGGGSDLTAPKGATYTLSDGSSVTKNGETISNEEADYNVVQVTKGTLTLNGCTLQKTGDTSTSGGDATSFYGTNASAFVSGSAGFLVMDGCTINSTADGANGVFAYNGGTATLDSITIYNNSVRSRGLHATHGGIIHATNIDITTCAETSSTIATDRGGGYVYVTGGTSTAKGRRSAVLYSTGTIEATGLTGVSEQGEIADVEGDNHVVMTSCDMTAGSSERGLMMLQSGSGDAEGSNAYITATSCTLTTTDSAAPLCEVPTLNNGTLNLTDCRLSVASGTLMYVDYNTQWKTYGGTGTLNLATTKGSWVYEGNVKADSYSNVNVNVGTNVTWNGANNPDNAAKTADVVVNEGGVWVLTADSHVTTLTNNGTVYRNGHTLTYGSLSGNGTISDGTTAISQPATVAMATPDGVYDLAGKCVGTRLQDVPAGIYVAHGGKVAVR